jgi:hypothetical protein
MDCFDLAWFNSSVNSYRDKIPSMFGGAAGHIINENPTLLATTKLLGLATDLAQKGTAIITQGTSVGQDQLNRIREENSHINQLVSAMKSVNSRVILDIKALINISKSKTIYLESMPDPYMKFFIEYYKKFTSGTTGSNVIISDQDAAEMFNRHFASVRDPSTHWTVDKILTEGPKIIMTHCRSSITELQAKGKIYRYMSIPSAQVISENWIKNIQAKCGNIHGPFLPGIQRIQNLYGMVP